MTNFYIGTNTYYILTCDSDIKVNDYTYMAEGKNISISNYKIGDDTNLEYMSSGNVVIEYVFNEKKELIEINKTV